MVESDDESDSDDERVDIRLLLQTVIAALVATDTSFSTLPTLPGRVGNERRDRESSILTVRSWSDEFFQRQFRLHRPDFNYALERIYVSLHRNEQMAINSSGSSISPELKLLITLRVLAGASYLDMIWYSVSVNHVIALVVDACVAIHRHIDNIKMPTTEAGFIKLCKSSYDIILNILL